MTYNIAFDNQGYLHHLSSARMVGERREGERTMVCPECGLSMHQVRRTENINYIFATYTCVCGVQDELQIRRRRNMFGWKTWHVRDDTWLPMPLRLWLWKHMVQYLPAFAMKKRKVIDYDKRVVCIYIYSGGEYMFTRYCRLLDLNFYVYTLEILGYSYEISNRFLEDRKSTRLNSSHSGESRMPSSA